MKYEKTTNTQIKFALRESPLVPEPWEPDYDYCLGSQALLNPIVVPTSTLSVTPQNLKP